MSTHQVVFVLLDLAVIAVLARLFGSVARRLGQPPVIGEILAGILLGPTVFGAGFSAALFPFDVRPFLTALADVGVTLFMFVVGLELDATLVRGRGRIAGTVATAAIVVPFGLGVALATYLLTGRPVAHRLGFVLFLGAAMSVTAFPVLARILTDRGLARTSLGTIALTCAAVGDVLAWCLLAVVIILSGGGSGQLGLVALLPVYVALMFLVVRPLLRRLLAGADRLGPGRLAALLAGVLVSAAATEWMGLNFVFGAFLFGAVLPRAGTDAVRATLLDRVEGVNSALLLPVFFVVTGLSVQLSGIGLAGLAELGLVLVVAVAGKFGGAFAGARLHRLPARKSAALATLMNTRGLTELIILSVGLQLGVLDRTLYSVMVAMAVITTAMAGPLLTLVHPSSMIESDLAEAGAPPVVAPGAGTGGL